MLAKDRIIYGIVEPVQVCYITFWRWSFKSTQLWYCCPNGGCHWDVGWRFSNHRRDPLHWVEVNSDDLGALGQPNFLCRPFSFKLRPRPLQDPSWSSGYWLWWQSHDLRLVMDLDSLLLLGSRCFRLRHFTILLAFWQPSTDEWGDNCKHKTKVG